VPLNIFELFAAIDRTRCHLKGDCFCESEMTCAKTVRILTEICVVFYTLTPKYDLNYDQPFCFVAIGDSDFSASLSQCFGHKTLLRS
jgi:hypothetical protein